MAQYECEACGYIYDEANEEKKWDELDDSWVCPVCGVGKDMFHIISD